MELILLAITLVGLLMISFIMIYGLVDAYQLSKKIKTLQLIESRLVKRDHTLTKEESLELPEVYLQIHKGLEKRFFYQEKILKEVNGESKGKTIYELTEKMAVIESTNTNTCMDFLYKYQQEHTFKCFVSLASFIVMSGLLFIILFATNYMEFGAIVSAIVFICFIFYIRQIILTVPKAKKVKKEVQSSKKMSTVS